jgi:23S rRNA pseudouridine2605 synthase
VTCDRAVTPDHLTQLRNGIDLDDGPTGKAELVPIPRSKGKEVGIIIHEGRNRQVRRMFEALGYDVKKLDRVAYGPVTKEGIARGGTRRLSHGELRQLKANPGRLCTISRTR